jgi:protein-tyrosine phosphatase
MPLLEPDEYLPIVGVRVPGELYWVLTSPAPLAGMRYPRSDFPWAQLSTAGFSHVVALQPSNYNCAPLSMLFSEQMEDLIHGGPPSDPNRETAAIKRAVAIILRTLNLGEGVVVHCVGGRGRTGTVLGCVLRELGYGAKPVLDYLNSIHKQRGKTGWPEAPWQGEIVRKWKSDA